MVDGIAIPAGAPNAERARQFVEFVTSAEALVDQAARFPPHPRPHRRAAGPPSRHGCVSLTSCRWTWTWQRLADEGPEWMQVWDEQIKGRGAEYLAENPG